MDYTRQTTLDGDFDDIVATVEEALADEGFGILCDIDVTATFDQKLDEDFRNYRILGACNPSLASEALDDELTLGAVLPCNVIVYEADDGAIVVGAVDPAALVGVADNPALDPIAEEVGERFDRVLASL